MGLELKFMEHLNINFQTKMSRSLTLLFLIFLSNQRGSKDASRRLLTMYEWQSSSYWQAIQKKLTKIILTLRFVATVVIFLIDKKCVAPVFNVQRFSCFLLCIQLLR